MLTLQSMVFYNAHFMTLELHEAIKLKNVFVFAAPRRLRSDSCVDLEPVRGVVET
jgi:hypothetical protein